MKNITRKVWILSIVSLLTDIASEMLYPVMPLYLKTIGFSVLLIGVLEGVAEATAGLSKGYFGRLSDKSGQRVPFVRVGYSLSAVSKPMMAVLTYPWWIFLARTLDRFGKGIRTGARDAMLSDEAIPQTKGEVFGFHRSLDTLGAFLGPCIALIFLYFHPENYKTLFLLAFFPGVLAIAFTFLLKDKPIEQKTKISKSTFWEFLKYWKMSPKLYKKLSFGLLLFTLFNSSDVFLLLKLKQTGLADTGIIGIYIFYNFIYALFAYPFGKIADKIGLKKVLLAGILLFAIVYFGMAVNNNLFIFIILFLVYGIYAASTEGISKAWISNIVDREDVATAIGTFTGFQSICTMLASSIAGFVWYKYGSATTFLLTSIVSIIVAMYVSTLPQSATNKS